MTSLLPEPDPEELFSDALWSLQDQPLTWARPKGTLQWRPLKSSGPASYLSQWCLQDQSLTRATPKRFFSDALWSLQDQPPSWARPTREFFSDAIWCLKDQPLTWARPKGTLQWRPLESLGPASFLSQTQGILQWRPLACLGPASYLSQTQGNSSVTPSGVFRTSLRLVSSR